MFSWLQKYYWVLRRRTSRVELSYVERRTAFWKPLLMFLPGLAVLTIFTLIPIVWVVRDAFTITNVENPLAAGSTGVANFSRLFEDPNFMQAISNSLIYSLITVPVSILVALIISSVIASIVSRYLRGFLQTIFFLPYVTASVAVAIAFGYMFAQEGLINTITNGNTQWLTDRSGLSFNAMFVVSIQGVWSSLAFEVLMLTTAMLGISRERYKAASIDGAGAFKQFFSITLPSVNRTINFLLVLGLIGSIKVFPLALFNLDPNAAFDYGAQTLLLFVFRSVSLGQWGLAGASSVMLFIISFGFTIGVRGFFQLIQLAVVKGGEWRVQNRIKSRY